MPHPFVTLTIAGGAATVAGLVWTMIRYSRPEAEGGPALGNGVQVQRGRWAHKGRTTSPGGRFQGRQAGVAMSGSVSMTALKGMIVARRWADAAPLLLMTMGMIALILFGALAILVGLPNKFVGVFFVGMALYAILRTLIGFARA